MGRLAWDAVAVLWVWEGKRLPEARTANPMTIQRELGRRGVKAAVRALLESVGAKVYQLSEGKPGWKRPAGLPDMWVMFTRLPSPYRKPPWNQGVAFWVETKATDGELSEAQIDFQNKCFLCGIGYVCGSEAEVRAYLERVGVLTSATGRTP